jgi:mono/diheme cytochrome c family protein
MNPPYSILKPRWLLLGAATLGLCAAGNSSARNQSVARGQYLVERVMMCGDCHTPTVNGKPDRKRWLQGGPLPFRVAPGLASVATPIAGLPPGWTREQFVRFMETGASPGGVPARRPMPAYRLNADDANAVASYLSSLKRSR